MKAMDFIDSVVPSGGTYCVVGIKDKKLKLQKFARSIEEVRQLISESVKQGNNTYFGLASYKDDSGRKQDNTSELKSFFLDIDCGDEAKFEKGVGYIHKSEGYTELQKFIEETGLPRPLIVDSGGGWHAYWILDTAISVDTWRPLAEKFKKLCQKRKLFIDPAVPADSARVLRVPNTVNTAYGVKAQIIDPDNVPEPLALTQFTTPLLAACEEVGIKDAEAIPDFLQGAKRELDESSKRLLGNTTTLFSTIAKKSLQGKGCAQIDYAIRNAATLEEPRWYAAITVARKCDDRDTAIHKLSNKHPEYNYEATERKANQSDATFTCQNYQDNWPSTCEGCPHRGKINTPLALGKNVEFAEGNEIVVPVAPEKSEEAQQVIPVTLQATAKTITYPKLPFPYERGKNGGIYQHVKAEDGSSSVELVYENDLFVMKRIRDASDGEVLLFNLVLPMDGLQEFVIPLKHIGSMDKLRDSLAHHGVVAGKKKMEMLMGYILAANKELQNLMKRELSRPQFGWYDNNKVFVIGKHEIAANGITTSTPSVQTMNLAPHMVPTGNLEEWKTVARVLGRPGWEKHQLAALAGFGAPFMKFTGERGMTINMITEGSGTGKTLVQHFINSLFGHTDYLMLRKSDTIAARYHRFGVMNNICICSDELTNIQPADVSDLIYSFSEGRARNRMESGVNRERVNESFWASLHLTSSNASMADKLTINKSAAEAELMRLFEFNIEKPEELDADFAQGLKLILENNYGIAGEIFIKAIVADLSTALNLYKKVKTKVNNALGVTSRERYWAVSFSCMLTGGYIARKLGLVDWDIDKLFELLVSLAKTKRVEVDNNAVDYNSVLGEFLSENKGAILQINGKVDERTGLPNAPIFNPTVRVIGRYEPDNKVLYVIRTAFKDYCVKRQISYAAAITFIQGGIVPKGDARVRIMKGTGVDAPPVPVLVFTGNFGELEGVQDEAAG